MDLLKEKRKLKALNVLEKIKKFEKIEILTKYQQTISFKNDLVKNDEKLKALVSLTENEIQTSMQSDFLRSLESLPIKHEFLTALHLSKDKNSRYLSEVDSASVRLLSLLSSANAHQKLIAEKYLHELTFYREQIIEKGEAN